MTSLHVKICGLRSSDHVEVAAKAGAASIGFMFAPSRRRIEVEAARSIANQLNRNRPELVGVFVNADVAEMMTVRRSVGLDVIQLAGDESPTVLEELQGRIWKVLRFPAGTTLQDAREAIDPWLNGNHPVEAILVDASVPGAYGGTGHRADWQLAGELASLFPVILAGGLTPSNAAEAIRQVQPMGVDVSSGVEVDGIKDPDLIRDFLLAAHSTTQ